MLTMFFTLFQVESGAEPLMGWVGPWPAPSFFIFYFYSCMYTYFCLGVYYIYYSLQFLSNNVICSSGSDARPFI
jgi:hypothetical protein